MKPITTALLLLLIILQSCSSSPDNKDSGGNTPPAASQSEPGKMDTLDIKYSIVNDKSISPLLTLDIYVPDTNKIETLNTYLVRQYKLKGYESILLNYFSNEKVAKTYFDKQLSEDVSEKEKDRLFRSYIARYNRNPSTGYDNFSFEHR